MADLSLNSTVLTLLGTRRFKHKINPYRPLAQNEIRLLSILPNQPGEPLRCSLEHYNLAQSESSHTAVSYPWGPPEDDHHPCWVNGIEFTVRDNAYSILTRLRQPDAEVKVWIDCLCIDQHNKPEKSAQIKLMHAIYKQAARTIIWLGRVEEAYDEVVEFIRGLDADTIYNEFARGWEQRWILPTKTFILDLLKDHPRRMSLVDGAARLFFAVYWSRVWIRQEAAVGGNPQLLWGRHELSWKHVVVLAWIYRPRFTGEWTDEYLQEFDYASLESATETILSINGYRFHEMTPEMRGSDTATFVPLLGQMMFARSGLTTKAHDKVYALSSLSTDIYSWEKDKTGFLEPDYSKSWQEVYVNAARFFFAKSATAYYVLESAGLYHMGAGSDLPSWVPDWRHKIWSTMLASPEAGWGAGGNRESVRTKFSTLSKKQRSQLLAYKDYASIIPLCTPPPRDRCKISENPRYLELEPKEILPLDDACAEPGCKDKISKAEYNYLESANRAALVLEIQSCMQDTITYLSRPSIWNKEIDIANPVCRADILSIDAESRAFLTDQARTRIDGLYITDETLQAAYDWTIICAQDTQTAPATPDLVATAPAWRSWLADPTANHLTSRPAYHAAIESSFAFRDYRFAYTERGYICLVPPLCRLGDKITIFNGYIMPFVVRPVVGEWNMLLGQCYVHGMMTDKSSELMDEFLVKFDEKSGKTVVKRPQGDVRANGLKMEAGRYVDILETLGTRWVKLI